MLPADRKEALLILGFGRGLAARKIPVLRDRFHALATKQMLLSVGFDITKDIGIFFRKCR